MNKAQLVEEVADRTGLTKKVSGEGFEGQDGMTENG